MKYNPKIHHRRSIRLKGYDYSQVGAYFITICCQDRECRFGKIENDQMVLNEFGTIAYNEWNKLPERFSNFELDVFQIMPNHMHGIIVLVGAGFTPAQITPAQITPAQITPAQITPAQITPAQITPAQNDKTAEASRAGASPAPTGDIIGAYKSLVANECLKIFKSRCVEENPAPTMGKLWQRNYYEHIIRNEQSYQTISGYIISNPSKWKDDKFYSG